MFSVSMVIEVLGGLSLFLYGMKVMSEGLQKVAGTGLRMALHKVTGNRVSGILTGFGITAAIQSSSATTVMLVSFVNAGLLNLTQAIGVIMGANIGTTVTGWLVALLGFKIKIALLALPAITIGFFVRFMHNQRLIDWGEVLMGFGFLFFGLTIMKDALGDLKHAPEVLAFMSTYHAAGLGSTILVVMAGAAVTMVIQSSSATMALTMTLASQGLIDYPTCAALILGENIGTTITANIAAIGASTAARQAARAHMIFNVFGVVWMLACFSSFLQFVNAITPGDVYSAETSVVGSLLPDRMAAFHTLFNICNTLLFLPMATLLARCAQLLVAEPKHTETRHLRYISSTLIDTPPLAIESAQREVSRMARKVLEMYDAVMAAFNKPDCPAAECLAVQQRVQKLETLSDNLEKEITTFLVQVIRNTTSRAQSEEISGMLHTASNLERIADHGEILMKLVVRMREQQLQFTGQAREGINRIATQARQTLVLINENIDRRPTDIMATARAIEGEIDRLRDQLRKEHIARLNEGTCDVNQGLVFLDMLSSFEKVGDHAYNIAESISGIR